MRFNAALVASLAGVAYAAPVTTFNTEPTDLIAPAQAAGTLSHTTTESNQAGGSKTSTTSLDLAGEAVAALSHGDLPSKRADELDELAGSLGVEGKALLTHTKQSSEHAGSLKGSAELSMIGSKVPSKRTDDLTNDHLIALAILQLEGELDDEVAKRDTKAPNADDILGKIEDQIFPLSADTKTTVPVKRDTKFPEADDILEKIEDQIFPLSADTKIVVPLKRQISGTALQPLEDLLKPLEGLKSTADTPVKRQQTGIQCLHDASGTCIETGPDANGQEHDDGPLAVLGNILAIPEVVSGNAN